jgi:hypothetical protein
VGILSVQLMDHHFVRGGSDAAPPAGRRVKEVGV